MVHFDDLVCVASSVAHVALLHCSTIDIAFIHLNGLLRVWVLSQMWKMLLDV
jgi:hypothetical protein